MKAKKPKLMLVRFWDHVTFSGPASHAAEVTCVAVGFLTKETKRAYTLTNWVCEDNLESENGEHLVILKSAVVAKQVLRDY
jgi:hypothetical protein